MPSGTARPLAPLTFSASDGVKRRQTGSLARHLKFSAPVGALDSSRRHAIRFALKGAGGSYAFAAPGSSKKPLRHRNRNVHFRRCWPSTIADSAKHFPPCYSYCEQSFQNAASGNAPIPCHELAGCSSDHHRRQARFGCGPLAPRTTSRHSVIICLPIGIDDATRSERGRTGTYLFLGL
jgi:hypothetical protein